jgi:hypothetical protein
MQLTGALTKYRDEFPLASEFKKSLNELDWRQLYEIMHHSKNTGWDAEDMAFIMNKPIEILHPSWWDWSSFDKDDRRVKLYSTTGEQVTFYGQDVYIASFVYAIVFIGKSGDRRDDFKNSFYTKAHYKFIKRGLKPIVDSSGAKISIKFPDGNVFDGDGDGIGLLSIFGIWKPRKSNQPHISIDGTNVVLSGNDLSWSLVSTDPSEKGNVKQTDHLRPNLFRGTQWRKNHLARTNWHVFAKEAVSNLRLRFGTGEIPDAIGVLLGNWKEEDIFKQKVNARMDEMVKDHPFKLHPGWSDVKAVDKDGKTYFQERKKFWSNEDIDKDEADQIRKSITSYVGLYHAFGPQHRDWDKRVPIVVRQQDDIPVAGGGYRALDYEHKIGHSFAKEFQFRGVEIKDIWSEEINHYSLISLLNLNKHLKTTPYGTHSDYKTLLGQPFGDHSSTGGDIRIDQFSEIVMKNGVPYDTYGGSVKTGADASWYGSEVQWHHNTAHYAAAMSGKWHKTIPNQVDGIDGKDFQQIQNFYLTTRGSNQKNWIKVLYTKGEKEFGFKSDTLFLLLRRVWDNLKIHLEDEFLPIMNDINAIEKYYGYQLTVKQVYEQFVDMCAEALALQFLTFSFTLEVMKFYISMVDFSPDEWASSGMRKVSLDALEKAAEAAKKADKQAFDQNAGDAAKDSELAVLTAEEVQERQKFLKQCALLMNLERCKIVYQKEFIKGKRPLRYTLNRQSVVHTLDVENNSDRASIVNKIVTSPAELLEAFMASTPDIQSALVPKIRLFKVFNELDGSLAQIEFSFPRFYHPDDKRYNLNSYIEKGTLFRGGTGGIKSFNWKFEGTTPATARNDIEAELVLFFDNFGELLKTRTNDDLFDGNGKSRPYRFIDLLLLGDTDKEFSITNYDPKNYRIKVDVGWVIRKDKQFNDIVRARGFFSDKNENKINEALRLMNKSYYLNMVDHDLNFKDDGSVEVKIVYRAYLETAMKTSNLDALMTPQLMREKTAIKEEYDAIVNDPVLCKDPKSKKMFEELITTYNAIEINHKKRSHQSIVQRLVEKERMHYCLLDKADTTSFKRTGFFSGVPHITWPGSMKVDKNSKITVQAKTQAIGDDLINKDVFLDSSLAKFDSISTSPDDSQELVTFFYLGDLINVILDCFVDPKDEKGKVHPHLRNTKILLSSLNYIDTQRHLKNINISEIPIATEFFFEWMNDNVIKIKKRSYPVGLFIRDLCNKLVVDLLMEKCLNREETKQIHFHTMPIAALGFEKDKNFYDPFDQMPRILGSNHVNISSVYYDSVYEGDGLLPLQTEIPNDKIRGMFNYFLVHPVTDDKANDKTGDYYEDSAEGVHHLSVGMDRGIVKSIKFTKTDIQYLREARYFNHGSDGLAQLSAVYKATIEMVGNTLFYPGMEIFIDPRHLAGAEFDPTDPESTANTLGIGGYHLITRVQNTIAPGKFTTTIEALFVYSGDGGSQSFWEGKEGDEFFIQEPLAKKKNSLKINTINDSCGRITFIRQQNFLLGVTDLENYQTFDEAQILDVYSKKRGGGK